MAHSMSTRAKWMITALIFALISIILALILPFAVPETIYDRNEHLVLAIPYSNFRYFAYSLLAIVLCFILLAFKRSALAIGSATITIILAIIVSSFALTGYISIQEQSLTVKELWQTETIQWEDVKEIEFVYGYGNEGDYIFTMSDNSQYVLSHSGSIGTAGKSTIYSKANQHNIPFIEKPKE